MSISHKMKFVVLCAVLSSLTIACDKKKGGDQTLAVAPQASSQPEAEPEAIVAEEVTLADQLLAIAGETRSCTRSSDIMKDAWVDRVLIGGDKTVLNVRAGTRRLSDKVAQENDVLCKMDVIAKTAQKMYDAHLKTPSPFPKTDEDKAMGVAKVEAFLAGIQPTIAGFASLLKLMDRSFADNEKPMHDFVEVMVRLGEKGASLDIMVEQIEEIANCSAYNCNQKTSNAAAVAKEAKTYLVDFNNQLDQIENLKALPGNIGFNITRERATSDLETGIDAKIKKAKAILADK